MRVLIPSLCFCLLVLSPTSCSRDEPSKVESSTSGACRITNDCQAPLVCVNRSCQLPAVVDPKAAVTEPPSSIPPPLAVNRPI